MLLPPPPVIEQQPTPIPTNPWPSYSPTELTSGATKSPFSNLTYTPTMPWPTYAPSLSNDESTPGPAFNGLAIIPPAPSPDTKQACPYTLEQSTAITPQSTLYYAVVPSSPAGANNGVLCARLEVLDNDNDNGWVGLGFSPDGNMLGQAVIGIPNEDTVLKYNLEPGMTTLMSADRQTLQDASIIDVDGTTIMTFTKFLLEEDEVPIIEDGENIFLHAWGGEDLGYHTGRLSFTIDVGSDTVPLSPSPSFTPRGSEEDSRLIAYVANWEECPTLDMLDGYTHIVLAFAVSYTWSESGNICNEDCKLDESLPICLGETPTQVEDWKALGIKVVLSFGGAGMGGSWSGDANNCWDYCFGEEMELSDNLVSIVSNKGFDGIDIDYEYCYDVAGGRHGRDCSSGTGLYTDQAAQNFLSVMTRMLREKLDEVGPNMELTHAPMDVDLVSNSPYYAILRDQSNNLNFLMPQVSKQKFLLTILSPFIYC